MPRRLLGICILLLVPVMSIQAQGDAVLMKVGPEVVERGEFEYYYRKSVEKDLHHFLQAFIDYKLKVLHAKELGLDTVRTFRKLKEQYDRLSVSGQASSVQSLKGSREWVRLSHVTFPLKQHAGKEEEQAARQKADSVYASWRKGSDWKLMSETLPWMQTRFLLKEWQDQLGQLEKNQVSPPFYSPQGIHLIAWEGKTMTLETETMDSVGEGCVSRLGQEMGNALLVAAWNRKSLSDRVVSEEHLENYFRQHREAYGWGVPHFRGIVVHCQSKKEAKAIKKYLRKYPIEWWKEAMERMPETLSSGCTFETGLFRIGDNAYVDRLAFKCGSFTPLKGYPYVWVLGDKLKKGPESFVDVREKVEAGYRNDWEKAQTELLKLKYRVEINEEVLKTVNNEGNK